MANAADIQKMRGLLVWVSRVMPNGATFVRGFHRVLQLLRADSLPAAQARKIIIFDPALIQELVHDLTWWIDLCRDFHSRGAVPRDFGSPKLSLLVFLRRLIAA